MRLTLRTLLAYLDDTLDPVQARHIGQKVAESEIAQQVIQRIKEVTRRQDLAVPPSSGPQVLLDVNTVAEYLDNLLPPEKTAEVEEVCLNSEVYLAEVAACHQILSLLSAEPVRVPRPARERMYALSKGRPAARRAVPAAAAGEETDREVLPQLNGNLRRFGPLAAALALIVALGIVIWQLLLSGPGPAPDSRQVAQGEEISAVRPTSPSTETEPKPPQDEVPAKPAEKPSEPPPPEPTPPPPPEKPAGGPMEIGRYVGATRGAPGVLVSRSGDVGPWRTIAVKGAVPIDNPLVSLPGFRNEIQLNSGVQVILWGSTVAFTDPAQLPESQPELPVLESKVRLHEPKAPFDAELSLDSGRIVLVNQKPGGSARVNLRFEGQAWDITLTEPGTVIAAELWGRYPPNVGFNRNPGGEGPVQWLLLFCLRGHANLKVGYDVFGMPESSQFFWTNAGQAARSPERLTQDRPVWWIRPGPQLPQEWSAALASLAADLEKEGSDVAAVLDRVRPENDAFRSSLAVLAMGGVDDLGGLVDALQDSRPTIRDTAVFSIRHWIGDSAEGGQRLYKFLQDRKDCSPAHAEIIMHLLHTFSQEALGRPETYETLIAYLLHETPAIRELAHWHLIRIVPAGRKIPYDSMGPEAQREAAFKEWKKLIPDDSLPRAAN